MLTSCKAILSGGLTHSNHIHLVLPRFIYLLKFSTFSGLNMNLGCIRLEGIKSALVQTQKLAVLVIMRIGYYMQF